MLDPEVSQFLVGLPGWAKPRVAALRRLVRTVVPQAEESVVWNSLSYHRPELGGRVKGAVCLIVVRRDAVRLDFIHGVRLADPAGLLRGRGVAKRYVPIESPADAEVAELAELIRCAAQFDPSADAR